MVEEPFVSFCGPTLDFTMSTDSSESTNVLDVQEHLLEMLRSVGKEAPPRREPTPAPAPAAPVTVPAAVEKKPTAPKVRLSKPEAGMDCPKCGSTTPWGKSSWCPECGYYPAAGFEGSGVVEEEQVKTLREIIPPWAIPLAIGIVLVLAGCIATRFAYPSPLQRALTALFVLLGTSLVVALTHAAAVMFVMRADGLGFMAIINVTDTWRRILISSDKTKKYILFMGWGLTGVLSSMLIGLNIDLLADEMLKDMKNKPKPSIGDMIGSFMRITTKALGRAKGAGEGGQGGTEMLKDIMAGVTSGMDDGGGSGGGTGEAADLESAMASFSEVAEGVTEESSGGGEGGGDLENGITGLVEAGPEPMADPATDLRGQPGEDRNGNGIPDVDEGRTQVTMLNHPANDTSPKSTPATALGKASIEYIVCGYTANPEGEPRSLLLAQKLPSGPLRFVMKLSLDESAEGKMDSEKLTQMAKALEPYRIRNPAVASPYGGKWVNPVVKVILQHDGLTTEKRPRNPKYQSLILPSKASQK